MTPEQINTLLILDKKERLLNQIITWLKVKKLYNECMNDCGQDQLIDPNPSTNGGAS